MNKKLDEMKDKYENLMNPNDCMHSCLVRDFDLLWKCVVCNNKFSIAFVGEK